MPGFRHLNTMRGESPDGVLADETIGVKETKGTCEYRKGRPHAPVR